MRHRILGMTAAAALSIASSAALFSSSALAQTADDAFGLWLDPRTGGHLEVLKCGDRLCAKIAKVITQGIKDMNNVDPALRDRPLLGLMIMEGATRADDTTWEGSLYDRSSGKTYSGKVVVKGPDTIEVKGCLMSFICRGNTLTRVK